MIDKSNDDDIKMKSYERSLHDMIANNKDKPELQSSVATIMANMQALKASFATKTGLQSAVATLSILNVHSHRA